jgi:diadenosine tetraphosphate (Ap4A) HIT family hydrolase
VSRVAGCPLCEGPGGTLIVQQQRWRLIRADEPGFPAFYRLVWTDHVTEFSDLGAPERAECMDAVVTVEQVLRRHLAPAKVNLASLGNAVPHLHWHVVARFPWDSHYPGSAWSAPLRPPDWQQIDQLVSLRPALEEELLGKLGRTA